MTIDPSFYMKDLKNKYPAEESLYAALLIIREIADKRKKSSLSDSARQKIISRLRKGTVLFFEKKNR